MMQQYGEELTERVIEHYGKSHVTHCRAQPVAPGDVEPHIIAKTLFCVLIDTCIEIRTGIGQHLEVEHKEQHSHSRNNPGDDSGSQPGSLRHVLRDIENTSAYHGTEDDGDESAQS